MRKQGAITAEIHGRLFKASYARLIALSVALSCLNAFGQSAPLAQSIGEVEQLRGAGFAQREGQLPRVLGRGLALNEGDRLTTADNALAIIKLKDGTKMTLRPGTELVLSQYSYSDTNNASSNSAGNSMVLQLLRGGLRTLTGLIGKASPNAAKIQTNTATIGIRGTDFDTRICKSGECGVAAAAAPTPSAIGASARVLKQQGQLTALDEQGQRRVLSIGASVYPGDTLETGSNATALLAFRDESKINLGSSTRMRVDDFAYDAADLTTSRYFMSLLRGSLRAVTGVIGKANRQNVRFTSSTATVGIRGTEFAMDCTGACAQAPTARTGGGDSGDAGADGDPTSGLTLFTFNGVLVVALTPPGSPGSSGQQTAPFELVAGRGLVVSGLAGVAGLPLFEFLTAPPAQLLTDSPADFVIPPETFIQASVPEGTEGVFVFVREGHVVLSNERQQIDLGRNEAAFSGLAANVIRLQNIPNHVLNDSVPLPTSSSLNIRGLRPLSSTDPICRP